MQEDQLSGKRLTFAECTRKKEQICTKVGTLEYRINVQQILFKFWVLAHLHAYFVLHNSTEKNVVQNLFFTTYLLPTRLFGLHVYSVH